MLVLLHNLLWFVASPVPLNFLHPQAQQPAIINNSGEHEAFLFRGWKGVEEGHEVL